MDFAPEEQRVYRLMKLKGLAPAEPPISFGENQDGVFNVQLVTPSESDSNLYLISTFWLLLWSIMFPLYGVRFVEI
jgi:hypothetical protein